MKKKRNWSVDALLRALRCYNTEPEGADTSTGGAGTDGKSDEGESGKKPEAEKGGKDGKSANTDSAADDLKKELEETKAKLKAKEDAEKAKEAEEAKNKMTLEQRIAAEEAEKKQLQKENLILKTRQKLGYTHPVYDAVNPQGDTPEQVESEFKKFHDSLQDFKGADTRKNTDHKATGAGTPGGDSSSESDVPTSKALFSHLR
jgi:chemotaxis protein histidine kinase CheA